MSTTKNESSYTYREKLKVLYESNGTTPAIADKPEKRNTLSTNASLWLDKYIKNQGDTSSKGILVQETAALNIPVVYKQFYQRWEQGLRDYGVQPQHMRLARTKGRMVIGLGEESVLETSIALHHIYGIPYIPGSALKGLAANYARQQLGAEWKKDSPAYQTIFGDTNGAGAITFFDALLYVGSDQMASHQALKSVLHQDTITVHHPGYYQGKKDAQGKPEAPSDWDSPTPIPFLSATGSYLIALAAPNFEGAESWIDTTFEILDYALEEMGIGAKTSSGYGRMTLHYIYLDEKTQHRYEEKKRLQNEERQRRREEEKRATEAECHRREEEKKRIEAEARRVEAEKQSVKTWKDEIERLSAKDIASRIRSYYDNWLKLTSNTNRLELATAIITQVRRSNSEKNMLKKEWYQEIVAYVNESHE